MRLAAIARFVLLVLALMLFCSCASSVRPTTVGLPDELHATIYGKRPMVLLKTHLGVWEDVKMCLGAPFALPSWGVIWTVADSIHLEDGTKAYGLTVWHEGSPPEIILEAPAWLNIGIISHEAIHVLTESPEHVGEQWLCQMPDY